MKFKLKALLVLLVICSVGYAKTNLRKQIDSIIGSESQKKARFSIHIINAGSGKTIYRHNADTALVPASNIKIITTAASLKYLGPDYRYKTRVGLCGDTLVIIGCGDPLLGDAVTDVQYGRKPGWILEDIAARLKQRGIKTIKDIVVDSTVFNDVRVHPNWPPDELNRWYACEVAGLNYNQNCVDITVKNILGRAVITVEPHTSFIKIINQVRTITKGKGAVGAYRVPQKPNDIVLKGKCRSRQGPFAVAIERPAAFFGFLLAEKLAETGISAHGQLMETSIDPNCDFSMLAEYTTSLDDCLKRCNKDSFGLAAEALAKTIAAETQSDHKNATWNQGTRAIEEYLRTLDIAGDEFFIDDGSGLSRNNKLSARAITTVLLDMYNSSNWKVYKQSLAAGGIDGTIQKYFRNEKYKGKILGKTGYINHVKSFSGLCVTDRGDFIFAVIANNANDKTRSAINDVAKTIIDCMQ